MKHNLIKTDNYLLVVDDSEIKEGDYFYRDSGVVSILTKELLEYYKSIKDNDTHTRYKIISHAPLNGAPYLDGVDRLPPIDNGDDVEILIPFPNGNEYRDGKEIGVWMKGWVEGHEEGYNKAREKYKFTEKDARQLIMYSFLKGVDRGHYSKEIEDRIIQTIQQHKLPIAFECIDEYVHDDTVPYPKTLGTQSKTVVNSEGRTEWVGKYIYE